MTDQEKVDRSEEAELFGTYAEDKPVSKEEALDDLEAMGGFIPIVGDAIDAKNVSMALSEGDYGEAALSAVGFVPFIGGALKNGMKATMELFRGASKEVQEEALRITSRQLERIPNPSSEKDVSILIDNALLVEQKKVAERSAAERPAVPRDGNEPVSFDKRGSLYHGTSDKGAKGIEKKGLKPSTHAEMKFDSVSTSRDPLYSARHFAKGEMDNMFEVKGDTANVHNMSPAEYDRARDIGGADEIGSGANIPKTVTFASEHETALFNPTEVERLRKTNPEKAAWIEKGMQKADKVMMDQKDMFQSLAVMNMDKTELTPAEAKKWYNAIRDNMKEALSLAQYTSDNSARGTYDWYIRNWSRPDEAILKNAENAADLKLKQLMDEDPSVEDWYEELMDQNGGLMTAEEVLTEMGEDVDELYLGADMNKDSLLASLTAIKDKLVGEQPKAEMQRMIDSIDAYDENPWLSGGEFGELSRATKKNESGRLVAQTRAEEIAQLKEAVTEGKLTPDQFKASMSELTAKYKGELQKARKADKEDPFGFIPTAERMNKGGLVT